MKVYLFAATLLGLTAYAQAADPSSLKERMKNYRGALSDPTAPKGNLAVSSVGVEVKEIGTGKGIDRVGETSPGVYEKDSYRTKGLELSVRNVGRTASGECSVEVYWLARSLDNKGIIIHHREAVPVTVAPVSTATARFWSPLNASNVTTYAGSRYKTDAGSKIDGWMVAVSRAGEIVAGRASSPTFETLLRSPEQLKPMLAAYQPSGRVATSAMPTWRTDPIRAEWREKMSGTAPYNPK
jgi:hypothetical protein